MKRVLPAALGAALIATLATCADESTGPGTPPPPPPPRLAIASAFIYPTGGGLLVGDTLRLTVFAFDSAGARLPVVAAGWRSSDTTKVRVSPGGLLTARKLGWSVVSIDVGGRVALIDVLVVQPAGSMSVDPDTMTVMEGAEAGFPLVMQTSTEAGAPLYANPPMWTSTDPTIATATRNLLTARRAGRAVLTARLGTQQATLGVHVISAQAVSRLRSSRDTVTLYAGDTSDVAPNYWSARPVNFAGGTIATKAGMVRYTSSDTSVVAIDSVSGRMFGKRLGHATLTAAVESVTVTGRAGVERMPVLAVGIAEDSARVRVGETVALTDSVWGHYDVVLTDRVVTWASSDPAVATVSDAGAVTGVAPGVATISATSEGKSDTVRVRVRTVRPPTITGVSPDVLVAGETATLAGTNFRATPDSNVVTVAGARAVVTAATPTQLTIEVPSPAVYGCRLTEEVRLELTTLDGDIESAARPLQVAPQLALAAGQSVALLGEGEARCLEMPPAPGRYLISVLNTGTTGSATVPFRLIGRTSADAAARIAAAPVASSRPAVAPPAGAPSEGALPIDRPARRRAAAAHGRVLDANRELLRRVGSPLPLLAARRAPGAAARPAGPSLGVSTTVGAVSTVHVPDLTKSDFCTSHTDVSARTVYVGSRSIILEDVLAPLAGTMDTLYQAIGAEFDNTMFGILERNFGNPLALDTQLDNNGRVVMLFTPRVNSYGLGGFVTACDFFPNATFASSNEAEIFYARVPTNAAAGFSGDTRANWRRTIRGTVIHEVKHITSFAERLSRGSAAPEESWLEEGTAMLAEELWARPIYGAGWKSNAAYAATLYCDVRPTFPECAGRPYAMYDHFAFLYDYYDAVETRSMLALTPNDPSFYGSAWLFARWAIDHYAGSEDAFIRALTQEAALTGTANVAARTGRSFAELLADFSLALVADEWPFGTTPPARAELRLPSWNTRDIFAAMSSDFPAYFPSAFPLRSRQVVFGAFAIDVPALQGGTAAVIDLQGAVPVRQLLELASQTGGAPPAALRMAIVRVQ